MSSACSSSSAARGPRSVRRTCAGSWLESTRFALSALPVTSEQMRKVHDGERTEQGLRENIRVGVQYIEAWLRGRGAVPLYNLMEDAATAEISRTQIWQWVAQGASLADGRKVTPELFKTALDEEMAALKVALGAPYETGRFAEAIKLFADMSLAADCAEFLTLPAYEVLE